MARTRYGKTFTTRRGRRGRYKYVNNRRVGFVATKSRRRRTRKQRSAWGSMGTWSKNRKVWRRDRR